MYLLSDLLARREHGQIVLTLIDLIVVNFEAVDKVIRL